MDNIKTIIANNIIELRKINHLTQAEMANMLNYSDKAVSKWERGESMPDISILIKISKIFGITLDDLVSNTLPKPTQSAERILKNNTNRKFITGLCIMLIWLVAAIIYATLDAVPNDTNLHLLSFVYAIPATLIVWLIFNTLWFNSRLNFFIISLLMWTVLGSLQITFLMFGINLWMVFIPGIAGQAAILLWSGIKY